MEALWSEMQSHAFALLSVCALALAAWITRWFERRKLIEDKQHAKAMAQLDLEVQRLTIEQELLAEKRRRIGQRPTPTGIRHEVVKASASQSFPTVTSDAIDASIKRGAKTAGTLVKKIAPSIMPTPSESAEQLIHLPPLDDLPRPTATVDGFGDVDIDVRNIADAHEGDE